MLNLSFVMLFTKRVVMICVFISVPVGDKEVGCGAIFVSNLWHGICLCKEVVFIVCDN